ncbi:putative baseplate assembly protein [Sphaerisporangium siamense]|uniref:Putative phage baseplate assembly protein n=1 Tax=Sphaerisporangium siamense TaxID=795645 RepID=A0A7W7GCB2_9ACTN|nr:putative baseplate assembly protein [Sphaerisporangium siamense]MBB4701846.1 putative phage baseplate assembly protein [Sphaerisporangium siamense]GII84246.1 putative baseplate assembly protein [Sphaerisporangium siamense]
MTGQVWWERAADDDAEGRIVPGPGPSGVRPELVEATREAVRAAVRARIPGYTPDWTNSDRRDAGVALVRLFGTQAEPVLARVNRLPEKALAEHLATAGVRRRPAGAAVALLEFAVNPPDGASVLVPAGFQATVSGTAGQVIYETDEDLYATPATLAALAVQEAGSLQAIVLGPAGPGRPFAPFRRAPEPGNGLWIGLAGTASPYPALTLGFVVAAAPPAPAASGGLAPVPSPPPPLLRWDVLDGGRFVPVTVVRDDTGGLRASGTVELRVPRSWEPSRPPGPRPGPPLRWLRLRIAHGAFDGAPPAISGLRLNMVAATAARTIRDEPLQPVQDPSDAGRRRMTLSQVPILAGSVVIEVDDDAGGDVFGTTAARATRWEEVESLAAYGPDDRVFVVDHATGEVTFGDGVHGAAVPPGFRNVRAARYRVGGGAAGAVRAGAVNAVVTALPFVAGVTNPFPASGGTDAEPDAEAIRRGAGELRARGRAVTPADYGLLAAHAPGASVARAHGVAGLHPDHPGVPIPGVVGVLVVPPAGDDGEPPVPTAATLRAVAGHLTREVAPAGVTVVAGPVRYARVAVDAWVVLDPGRDRAGVLAAAGDAVTAYLDPLRGGDSGAGWPFGGALRHTPTVRRLLAVDGVRAVSRLTFTVDGLRLPPCADHAIAPHTLVWPERPLLIPVGDRP